jgi:hypothetical protein
MGMCFNFECSIGFLERLIALVLSQWIMVGSSNVILISCRVCFIHSTCVQHSAAAIYSALVLDKEIEDCFLLIQATSDSPKRNALPLVLFLSSILPAQSTYEYDFNVNESLLGYQKPKSMVPFKYMKILFIA